MEQICVWKVICFALCSQEKAVFHYVVWLRGENWFLWWVLLRDNLERRIFQLDQTGKENQNNNNNNKIQLHKEKPSNISEKQKEYKV